MKAAIIILIFTSSIYAQNPDPTSLWIFRMEQDAKENVIYKQLQGSIDGYPKSTGLLEKNDTIRYQSGQTFRTCEVQNHELNGKYQIYYPVGTLYLISYFKNNQLVDSTSVYDDKGSLLSTTKHDSRSLEHDIYYNTTGKVKRVDHVQIVPASSATFRSGYEHVNTKKIKTSDFYDDLGNKINKEQYLKLYPQDK